MYQTGQPDRGQNRATDRSERQSSDLTQADVRRLIWGSRGRVAVERKD